MSMRKVIRNFLNKRNYEIIKQPYVGDKYPNLSKNADEYYCETPIGNFYVPLDFEKDPVANTIVRGKLFEPEVIAVAKKYIKDGTAVLDIGANFGQMSVNFSKMVGENGKVFSFEAQKVVANILRKNLAANKCNNVELFDNAVFNKAGETLYFPEADEHNFTAFSSTSVSVNDTKGIPVTTITIDSLQIDRPISFMKVDIEGSDIFALQGAKETILKNRMPIIFEYAQQMQDDFSTSFGDYVDFVNSIDYTFREVVLGINYLVLPR